MIVNKVTVGFVIQTFDTKTKKFTAQTFVAGDQVSWENTNGEPVKMGKTAYLPFDMVQPSEEVSRR
jgi:hypothetical protein